MADQNSNNQNQQRRLDPELLKEGLRCDLDQYEMLKRCSDKKDMTEWNQWRENHPMEEILLEGADLLEKHLKSALLNYGGWGQVHLNGATLMYADMEEAFLVGAHLEKAFLNRAHLEGTCFDETHLEGTIFCGATFDARTSFSECLVYRSTDFRETNLETLRIRQSTKQLLEYNIRRMNWEEWYKTHWFWQWLVRLFWWITDYGLSTGRIIAVFIGFAFCFAFIYWLWGLISPPGIVDNLFVVGNLEGNSEKIASWLVPFRAIHFSVVIMTVGFTNMHANAHSFWAHILVGFQMILGFVLLGALVTRFAVLFTAGGPAGKFADEQSISDRLKQLWARIKGKDIKQP